MKSTTPDYTRSPNPGGASVPRHRKLASIPASFRSLAALQSHHMAPLTQRPIQKLTKSSDSSPRVTFLLHSPESQSRLSSYNPITTRILPHIPSAHGLKPSIHIHKGQKPPLPHTTSSKPDPTRPFASEQSGSSGEELQVRTVAPSAGTSPRFLGETLTDLQGFTEASRARYSRRHSALAVTAKAESQPPQPQDAKPNLLDLQPVLNLRTINTNELLRTDSEEAEDKHVVLTRKKSPQSQTYKPQDTASQRSLASEMKLLKTDYQLATSSVLSDTRSLVRGSSASRKVPQRLLNV